MRTTELVTGQLMLPQALGSRGAGVNLRCFFNSNPARSCIRKSLKLNAVGASLDKLAVGDSVESQPIIFCYGSDNPHGGLHGLEPTWTGNFILTRDGTVVGLERLARFAQS